MKIVREWDGSDAPQRDFDLAIGVLGFESRSTWMLRSRSVRADRHLGLRFGYNETMHFAEAEKLYQRIHGDVILLSEHEPCRIITDYVKEHLKENAAIVVDVSAMSRLLMAKVLVALAQCTYLKR